MDVIVFGASSFVGRIVCRHLWDTYGHDELEWAIAGRSENRLQEVKRELGAGDETLPHFVADAADDDALRRLCERTSVVASTVGPYALYGEPLVRACAETGTDYCDLTGEVQWIRRMIDRYEERARNSGARIVHACGFDSIPSDLGVHFLQEQVQRVHGRYSNDVRMRVRDAKGGASGGTIASLLNVFEEAAGDKELRKELADPYSLCPRDHPFTLEQRQVGAEYDSRIERWIAPFFMEAVNTRIVHRSNALRQTAYGQDFLYEEAVVTGAGKSGKKKAKRLARGSKLVMGSAAFRPFRWVMRKFLPKPGQGPSPEEQANGYYDLLFLAQVPGQAPVRVTLSGDRDPGYGSTARMIGEAAVCLARDEKVKQVEGGFPTPAAAMGDRLRERLIANAGIRFEAL